MTETADVVIIGSGIVGSSVAYHLAEQGCTNVLVIEREAHQGKGSTGKSMGGVRAQFSTPREYSDVAVLDRLLFEV